MPQTLGSLTFAPPAGWTDATIAAFVAPSSDPKLTANVTIAREVRRGSETLKTHAHRYLLGLASNLPSFDMREMADMEVGGRPAVRIRGEWLSTEGLFEQTSVHLMPDASDTTVTTITVTCSSAASHIAAKALADVLASVRFAREGHTSGPYMAVAPPRTPPPPSWDDVDRTWR